MLETLGVTLQMWLAGIDDDCLVLRVRLNLWTSFYGMIISGSHMHSEHTSDLEGPVDITG